MSISVLVATFGDREWERLADERTLPSLRRQDRGWELIARHQDEGPVTSSRNACAKEATGDWLLFVDADDELAPGFFGAMERAVEREGTNGDRLLLTPALNRPGRSRKAFFLPEKPLSDNNWLVIGTLIQRDFFWEIGGFDEQDPHGLEDWSLWTRAAAAGARVVKVPDAVYIAHTRRLSSHALYARNPEYGVEYTRIRRAAWPELYA